jgi:hypothetical protein
LNNRIDDFFQLSPFFAQFLGLFRVIPDVRIFQFPLDFIQALLFGFKVKGTPSERGYAPACL